jgi:hypothetical protein
MAKKSHLGGLGVNGCCKGWLPTSSQTWCLGRGGGGGRRAARLFHSAPSSPPSPPTHLRRLQLDNCVRLLAYFV